MDAVRMPQPGDTKAPSRQDLLRIYEQTKTIAVVGASANEHKAAHVIPRYLQSQGYRIIPVNPKGGEILGEHVYTSLEEIEALMRCREVNLTTEKGREEQCPPGYSRELTSCAA